MATIEETVITYLAGIGTTFLPLIVQKIWKFYQRNIKYKDVIKTYSVITPEISLRNLNDDIFFKVKEMVVELARLDQWDELDRIFTNTVYSLYNLKNNKKRLYRLLGEELTEKWITKYKDRYLTVENDPTAV